MSIGDVTNSKPIAVIGRIRKYLLIKVIADSDYEFHLFAVQPNKEWTSVRRLIHIDMTKIHDTLIHLNTKRNFIDICLDGDRKVNIQVPMLHTNDRLLSPVISDIFNERNEDAYRSYRHSSSVHKELCGLLSDREEVDKIGREYARTSCILCHKSKGMMRIKSIIRFRANDRNACLCVYYRCAKSANRNNIIKNGSNSSVIFARRNAFVRDGIGIRKNTIKKRHR